EGVAKQKAILDRYNELAANYSDETADEMTKLQDEIEAQGLWDLDSKVDQAMDALRCPPDDADVTKLSGGERRRVALCRLLLDQEGREEAAHQRTLAREQEWIAASPRARQAKSKARYQRYEELLRQAGEKQTQTAQITIPVAERLGNNVVDFEGLSKGFGDQLLIDDLTFKLPPGGIVGVIGPNGAGKTTLFRMITGQDKPDAGEIKIGESVQLGYVDQSRDSLEGNKTVWEEISGGNDQ